MAKQIYLDNASTTPVDSRVLKVMQPFFSEDFGNPGSMHDLGLSAREAMSESRQKIASILNCKSSEIIFAGSGTESINLAITGVAMFEGKGHIITSNAEHKAVLETCKYLEKQGFKITYLDVDKFGMIDPKDVEKTITPETILVSIMYANNEIGTINPLKDISKITRKHNIIFHTDACQAGGYLNIDINELGVDLLTLNSSKIYGPKGVGLLYIRKGVHLTPIIHGGGQENRLRSGTENVSGIVGFAEALRIAQESKPKESERLIQLVNILKNNLLDNIPKIIINGNPNHRLPNNLSVSFLDVEGESIVLHLNEKGILAATGSACTSNTLEPSHVLLATGLTKEAAHGTIRFSLGRHTTEEDIEYVIKILPEIITSLRMISPISLTLEKAVSGARTVDEEKIVGGENK